ncbi:MAG TPA: cytochrome D1 domain-containing protein [Thermoguttaceae bacterium]|nr:cytochrome D1 domain-containing protein [Thermoguttaceae bacterium]
MHNPVLIAALAMVAASSAALSAATASQSYLGPVALVASHEQDALFVACADARKILEVDLAGGHVARHLAVPGEPTGLVLSRDGTRLVVTCAAVKSTVCVIDPSAMKVIAKIPAGHTAVGPVISPDGQRLYVCNRFDNDVSVIDLAAGKELARVAVTREPIGGTITPDGRSVLVINHLPADPANSFFVAAVVTAIDTQTHRTTTIRLPNGATSVRAVCITPDGRYALITHVLSNYELVPAQLDFGWTNINALSVIDAAELKLVNTVVLDDMYLGAANPWGLACTADGKHLCIAHSGTHELSVVDWPAVRRRLLGPSPDAPSGSEEESGDRRGDTGGTYGLPTVNGIPNSMGLMTGLRQRIELAGKGPRGVAVVDSKMYVAGYFSDTIDVVDVSGGTPARLKTIALGPQPRLTARRFGELLFHDATICYQHWQSCSTCHPDARADVLNWDLLNDGVGNPKNTKSMLLAHRTPPAMATGVRATAEAAVRAGIQHTLFTDRPEAEAAAIDAYLRALEPVPSPRLDDGRLSPAAERGRRLFESEQVGCARCHPAPLYTDLLMHDVDSRGPYDFGDRFDTPTLIEAWRTAPYLHDGRYTTIEELIVKGRHGLSRSQLERLSERQIADLVEFVLSL